jgi:hypothetical protein
LYDVGVDGRIILKVTLKKWGVKIWTEFTWLRIETNGGLL